MAPESREAKVPGPKREEAKPPAFKGRLEMMPKRSKPRRVNSREEAEQATAWWVKK